MKLGLRPEGCGFEAYVRGAVYFRAGANYVGGSQVALRVGTSTLTSLQKDGKHGEDSFNIYTTSGV